MTSSPTAEDVLAARRRLAGRAVRTPLLNVPEIDALAGRRVLVKAEVLQRTGSFKYRGAFNRLSLLSDDERRRGVVAYSSGNHAQAVAAAARELGIPAVIIMPRDAPTLKIENTRRHGAEVILYDRWRESREAIGEEIARERGLALVKPFDDPAVIAGQGTIGIELAEQAVQQGERIGAVLVPCSGGGLAAGIALALEQALPETQVYAVEPEGFDDTARSLAAGERLRNAAEMRSACDALLAPSPGEITFPILQRRAAGGLVVPDAAAFAAMATAFERLKLALEPGGAVALAAAIGLGAGTGGGAWKIRGLRRGGGTIDQYDGLGGGGAIAVICSGGNIDHATFCRLTGEAAAGH